MMNRTDTQTDLLPVALPVRCRHGAERRGSRGFFQPFAKHYYAARASLATFLSSCFFFIKVTPCPANEEETTQGMNMFLAPTISSSTMSRATATVSCVTALSWLLLSLSSVCFAATSSSSFIVEKAAFSIIEPESLKASFDSAIGDFGGMLMGPRTRRGRNVRHGSRTSRACARGATLGGSFTRSVFQYFF